jgi:hypothetical protein
VSTPEEHRQRAAESLTVLIAVLTEPIGCAERGCTFDIRVSVMAEIEPVAMLQITHRCEGLTLSSMIEPLPAHVNRSLQAQELEVLTDRLIHVFFPALVEDHRRRDERLH